MSVAILNILDMRLVKDSFGQIKISIISLTAPTVISNVFGKIVNVKCK